MTRPRRAAAARRISASRARPARRIGRRGASALDGRPATIPPFTISRGRPRDAAVVLRLIRGLAEYERLAHYVQATLARIRQHGFGRRRYFDTLICRQKGEPIGFALYFFTYSTFLAQPTLYLEDLFVLPDDRGHGAGRTLLQALAKIAVERGCGRMEWAVLDWNAPAIGFYERLGATLHKEWILTRLKGPALKRLAGR